MLIVRRKAVQRFLRTYSADPGRTGQLASRSVRRISIGNGLHSPIFPRVVGERIIANARFEKDLLLETRIGL